MCHDMPEAPKRDMDGQVQFHARGCWLLNGSACRMTRSGGDGSALVEFQAFWGLDKVHLTRCNELHLVKEHQYLRFISSQGTNFEG